MTLRLKEDRIETVLHAVLVIAVGLTLPIWIAPVYLYVAIKKQFDGFCLNATCLGPKDSINGIYTTPVCTKRKWHSGPHRGYLRTDNNKAKFYCWDKSDGWIDV